MNVINLTVENDRDLYNRFDPGSDHLSEDVKFYITERLKDRDPGDKMEICVVSESPVDQDRIVRAFYKWADDEERAIKKEFRKNMVEQLWMFAIGVLFIAVSLILEKRIPVVWFTVLSTIGAFSIWEAASIWIVRNPALRLNRKMVSKIRDDTIVTVVQER